jgi:hypothetical protein
VKMIFSFLNFFVSSQEPAFLSAQVSDWHSTIEKILRKLMKRKPRPTPTPTLGSFTPNGNLLNSRINLTLCLYVTCQRPLWMKQLAPKVRSKRKKVKETDSLHPYLVFSLYTVAEEHLAEESVWSQGTKEEIL